MAAAAAAQASLDHSHGIGGKIQLQGATEMSLVLERFSRCWEVTRLKLQGTMQHLAVLALEKDLT